MKRFIILTLFLFMSCSDEAIETPDNNLFIGQSGDNGYSIDNIEIHANTILASLNIVPGDAYISTRFVLSRDPIVDLTISGKYNDPLSASDLANLSSVGLTGVDQSSTKGHLKGMSKNPTADPNLAYNIRVRSLLYTNPSLTNVIANPPVSILNVGGDNFYQTQFMTRVKDQDYYLIHEWQTNELSAYELLPENNFRKISLGAPSTQSEFSELKFAEDLPKINDHEVGYTYSSETGKNVYKVTNDGSGVLGWSFNNMGASFGIDRWFVTTQANANNEAVLMTSTRLGNNSEFMSIAEWSGSAWSFTDLGAAAKVALSGAWVDANTYHSQHYKYEDGSIWVALNEGTSTIDDSNPLQPHDSVNGYLVSMRHISGDPKVLSNWNLSLINFSGISNIIKTRIRALHITSYDNDANLVAYLFGDGIAKLEIINGVSSVKEIAVFEGTDFLDSGQSFDIAKPGQRQESKYIHSVSNIKDNSFELLLHGPTTLFKLNTVTEKVTAIYMNSDGTIIKQSR